jgi:hypothetical protein
MKAALNKASFNKNNSLQIRGLFSKTEKKALSENGVDV